MESKYHYFKRDISWLSFNYRVLLEADDDSLPLYERINFISIYSSNLEEFYKIRVAEHKAIASGGQSDDMTQEEARHLIHQITEAVNSGWKTVSAFMSIRLFRLCAGIILFFIKVNRR